MRSKLSSIHKHYFRKSAHTKVSVIFKPVLKSKFVDLESRAVVNAYAHPYFKIFPTRFKIFCLHTGRARGVLSNYYFSRITFKKFSIKGELVGFRKSRW